MEKMRSSMKPAENDEMSACKEPVKFDLFSEMFSYKERENDFLASLHKTINLSESDQTKKENETDCNSYINPLLDRTSNTISTLITTKNAIDQLDSLHHLVHQLLAIQERNFHLRQSIKTVQTLKAIKINTMNIQKNPEIVKQIFEENSDDEMDLEQNLADLEAVLLASKSVNDKRNAWKRRRRSKSVIADDPLTYKEGHPKVSKWTKVKAAFKWEKTRALQYHGAKGFEDFYAANDFEVSEYLRYPSTSGDYSIFKQDRVLSNCSANSMFSEILKDESAKNDNSTDEGRRSRSLDSDVLLDFGIIQNLEKRKNKSAWKKVKDLVKPNRSPVRVLSRFEYPSRDISPCESYSTHPRNILPYNSLATHYLGNSNYLVPSTIDVDGGFSSISSDDNFPKHESRYSSDYSKKNKFNYNSADSENYKEPQVKIKNLPSPLKIQKNYIDRGSLLSPSCIPLKSSLQKKKLKTTSVPNSPSKSSDFFNEPGFFEHSQNSEPVTPSIRQRDEIFRKYQDLQSEISREFNFKMQEWDKLRPVVEVLTNSVPIYLNDEMEYNKSNIPGSKIGMENLSSDFQKKYDEWQIKKNQKPLKGGSLKFNSSSTYKSSDLQTKSLKFDESLCKIPDPKDLPSDFQKKLSEWKQMKSENRSSLKYTANRSGSFKRSSKSSKNSLFNQSIRKLKSYDSVDSIKSPKSSIKNEGASQKFSRKLNEWDNAKGFDPVDYHAEKTQDITSNSLENLEDDEPGAVIVEVEDEMPEISLTLSLDQNELDTSSSNMQIIINELIENLNNLIDEEISETERYPEYIKGTFKLILDILKNFDFPKMNESVRTHLDNAIQIAKLVFLQSNETDISMGAKEVKVQAERIKSILSNVLKLLRQDCSQESGVHQASESVQKLYSNVATVLQIQSFVCNPIEISEIKNNNSNCGTASCSDFETNYNVCEQPEAVVEPLPVKVSRNCSNVSKRRQKIERNRSKTESDSEDEVFTVETSRRLKRKSSKNKKHAKSTESLTHSTEELVYVFKIKPGESQSPTIETIKPNKVLISPTETSVSILSNSQEHLNLTSSKINCSNAIIKTQRMVFMPLEDSNNEVQNIRVSLEDDTEIIKSSENIEHSEDVQGIKSDDVNISSDKVVNIIKQFEEYSSGKKDKPIFSKLERPMSRSIQDFNTLQYPEKEIIRNRSFSECKVKMCKNIENNCIPHKFITDTETNKISKGAIPKLLPQLQPDAICNSFVIREKFNLMDDGTSGYLSKRAKKIKEAKEAFFLNSSEQQIEPTENVNISKYLTIEDLDTLPERNPSLASNISEATTSSKSPKFGFTSITSSLRKAINKNIKSTNKMNSITELCKQTLYLDITGSTRAADIYESSRLNSPK